MKNIILAILWCLCASALWAQGRLIGRVVGENNEPIAGATVSISGQTAMVAISNAQGYYVLLDVPQGVYEVKATKRGQPVWRGTVTITAGITQRIDMKLGGKVENLAAKVVPDAKRLKVEKVKKEAEVTEVKKEEEAEQGKKSEQEVVPVVATAQDLAQEKELQKAIEESEKLNLLDAEQANLPESDVEIVGGIEAIQSKIEYPMALKRARIEGTVIARVFVDEQGNPLRISIVQPANKFLNEEVIRVLTEETKFIPAKIGNTPVRGAITIPVKFKIQ